MEWFDGSIAIAIEKCRSKQAVFLVYIRNVGAKATDSDVQFDKVLDEVDTDQFDVNFIAIRLSSGSEDAKHFATIFPTPVIPALYAIGKSGTPLKVFTAVGGIEKDRFVEDFKKMVDDFHKTIEGDRPKKILKADRRGADDLEGRQLTLEEKTARARELLAKKKVADAEKEIQETKQKELERRKDGKAMLEAREKQKDREIIEAMEQRKREKAENDAQLKRLREQIKLDREERAKRAHIEAAPAVAPVMKPVPTDECRIQVKFPNGSNLIKQLPSAQPLQVLVDAIKEDGRHPAQFYLVQMYPRQELADFEKSLLDHGLTPSATILVVPESGKSTDRLRSNVVAGAVSATAGFAGYISFVQSLLLTPLNFMYQMVMSLFGFVSGNDPATSGHSMSPGPSGSRKESSSNESGQQQRNDRTMGNVRGLHDRRDGDSDDDSDARYNGNSTQQM